MLTSPTPQFPEVRRTLWQRLVRDPLLQQLTQGLSPDQLTLTVAIGSVCALFPIVGTTTMLCLLAGVWLRLNQPILQALNQLLWPAQILSIYFCTKLGEQIFRIPPVSFDVRAMGAMLWHAPLRFIQNYGASSMRAIAAWAILAPVISGTLYFSLRPLIRRICRPRTQA